MTSSFYNLFAATSFHNLFVTSTFHNLFVMSFHNQFVTSSFHNHPPPKAAENFEVCISYNAICGGLVPRRDKKSDT